MKNCSYYLLKTKIDAFLLSSSVRLRNTIISWKSCLKEEGICFWLSCQKDWGGGRKEGIQGKTFFMCSAGSFIGSLLVLLWWWGVLLCWAYISLQWGGGWGVFFDSLCRNIHLPGHKYVPLPHEWMARKKGICSCLLSYVHAYCMVFSQAGGLFYWWYFYVSSPRSCFCTLQFIWL